MPHKIIESSYEMLTRASDTTSYPGFDEYTNDVITSKRIDADSRKVPLKVDLHNFLSEFFAYTLKRILARFLGDTMTWHYKGMEKKTLSRGKKYHQQCLCLRCWSECRKAEKNEILKFNVPSYCLIWRLNKNQRNKSINFHILREHFFDK